jgi:hypothetical protein
MDISDLRLLALGGLLVTAALSVGLVHGVAAAARAVGRLGGRIHGAALGLAGPPGAGRGDAPRASARAAGLGRPATGLTARPGSARC